MKRRRTALTVSAVLAFLVFTSCHIFEFPNGRLIKIDVTNTSTTTVAISVQNNSHYSTLRGLTLEVMLKDSTHVLQELEISDIVAQSSITVEYTSQVPVDATSLSFFKKNYQFTWDM
ncbi:MAG: hypothetical protein AB1798_00145 [Spirochaetota bacterium]